MSSLHDDCPWPGPIPYSEEDSEFFFGREKELDSLERDICSAQHLTILTALSGVGKSSLLNAGLLPRLRSKQSGRRGREHLGPTILLNDWASSADLSVAKTVIQATEEELKRLDKLSQRNNDSQLKGDVKRLRRAALSAGSPMGEGVDAIVEFFASLCDPFGKMVLIIDQAEELLGSSRGFRDPIVEDEVLAVIEALFLEQTRIRLVISLREEYYSRLTPLGYVVKELNDRKLSLDTVPPEVAEDIMIRSAAASENVTLDRHAAQEILRWLDYRRARQPSHGGPRSVDLLEMQALLSDTFSELKSREKVVRIEAKALKELDQKRTEERRVDRALENYINRRFNKLPLEEERFRNAMVRRCTTRMARWLSSPGGFKIQVGEGDLLWKAVLDELKALGLKSQNEDDTTKARERVRAFKAEWDKETSHGSAHPVDGEQRLLIDFDREGQPEAKDRVSGVAREDKNDIWSLERVAAEAAIGSFRALRFLTGEKILKKLKSGEPAYELVHDGLGPALIGWADREQIDARGALLSIVGQRGEAFGWPGINKDLVEDTFGAKDQPIRGLSWFGCFLNGKKFKGVRFESCLFRGCVFSECTFEDCGFFDCDFKGAVFDRGKWSGVTWDSCTGGAMFLRKVTWSQVTLASSELEGTMIMDLKLQSNSFFKDCGLSFFQMPGLSRVPSIPHEKPMLIITKCDLLNALLEGSGLFELDEFSKQGGFLQERPNRRAPQRRRNLANNTSG